MDACTMDPHSDSPVSRLPSSRRSPSWHIVSLGILVEAHSDRYRLWVHWRHNRKPLRAASALERGSRRPRTQSDLARASGRGRGRSGGGGGGSGGGGGGGGETRRR